MIKYFNIILFAGMLVMNYLANALPLNGKTTGQLSDSFPNLFVPAGLTFSIWGIIYLLLIVSCVVQFTGPEKQYMSQIGWIFGLSCLLNAIWIVFWHYGKLPLSIIVMAGLLVSLVFMNYSIKDSQYGLVKASFGIYLGWICIATIANITALLVSYDWNGFGISEEAWTIIMIFTGTFIAALTIYRLRNPFIGLSVAWAFTGIALKRQDDFRSIFISAIIGLILIMVITIVVFFRKGLTEA